MVTFVHSMVEHFVVGPTQAQFALVTFAQTQTAHFTFNQFRTAADILQVRE
jgi:hypothetical protein